MFRHHYTAAERLVMLVEPPRYISELKSKAAVVADFALILKLNTHTQTAKSYTGYAYYALLLMLVTCMYDCQNASALMPIRFTYITMRWAVWGGDHSSVICMSPLCIGHAWVCMGVALIRLEHHLS